MSRQLRRGLVLANAFILAALAGCGGNTGSNVSGTASLAPAPSPTPFPSPTPSPSPSPVPSPSPTPAPSTMPSVDHVVLVVLENHSSSQVVNSPAMPFFNSWIAQYALAGSYFANTHPSLGNYLMLTTGLIETNHDNFAGSISDDNIVRALTNAGKTWKAYMENLPAQGYTGNDVFPYIKHHNPFVYLADVLNSSTQAANVVPFSQFASDLSSGSLPSFAFIVPNALDDAHSCPTKSRCSDSEKLNAADKWLQENLGPLPNSPSFGNGLLIVTWDEGEFSDSNHGGGQVATVLVGSTVKAGMKSTTLYQHQSTLRLILDLLSVADHPGASATAPAMDEFFR